MECLEQRLSGRPELAKQMGVGAGAAEKQWDLQKCACEGCRAGMTSTADKDGVWLKDFRALSKSKSLQIRAGHIKDFDL